MPDYYTLLEQKIREVEDDAAKPRELVYANARLALKRHVNVHYPAVSLQDGKRLIGDLEQAIERFEADKAGPDARPVAPGADAATSIIGQSASDRPTARLPRSSISGLPLRKGLTMPFARMIAFQKMPYQPRHRVRPITAPSPFLITKRPLWGPH